MFMKWLIISLIDGCDEVDWFDWWLCDGCDVCWIELWNDVMYWWVNVVDGCRVNEVDGSNAIWMWVKYVMGEM